jgi:transcriptional regulator with AAA-type ATPase domain
MPGHGGDIEAKVCDESSATLTDRPGTALESSGEPMTIQALVVLWSRDDPDAEGSVLAVPPGRPGPEAIMGRGTGRGGDGSRRLVLCRHRPGTVAPAPPITSRSISRNQLGIRALDEHTVEVRRLGRCAMLHNGVEVPIARVAMGDTIQLGKGLILLAVRRPAWLAGDPAWGRSFAFGSADPDGIVGESAGTWQLRRQISFIAPKAGHVLIRGASGTGKELVARALHAHSPRGARPLLSRNAATFPEGLIDAELFGNLRAYPNPGMPDRPGLVGDANGSSLYLDEIAELPLGLQSHLLRVLDRGEYQRLGESRVRNSDFRLIAATNRPLSSLKEDLAARLPFRIDIPDLNSRREDIPLLAVHLLRRIAEQQPEIRERFFTAGASSPRPRLSPALVRSLVRHDYVTHVRELEACLWDALARSQGDHVEFEAWPSPRGGDKSGVANPAEQRSVPSLDALHIQSALDEHQGHLELTRRALGLSSRHALARLISKFGLRAGRDWKPSA